MPENISSKKDRYISKYDIAPQVADILASDKYYSELFEKSHDDVNAKDIANLITTDLMGLVDTREKRNSSKLTSTHLSELINALTKKTITRTSAKGILQDMVKTGNSLNTILEKSDQNQISNSDELSKIVSDVLLNEENAANEAKLKPETINFLVGKVMQKTNGKADPIITLKIIKEKLGIPG